jgi:hypothetical protein
MTYKDIANLAVTGQALHLAGSSFPRKKKKKKITRLAVENIVGLSLLRASAQNVGSL